MHQAFKGQVCIRAKWSISPVLYLVSVAWRDQEDFYFSWDGMLVHRWITRSTNFISNPFIHLGEERQRESYVSYGLEPGLLDPEKSALMRPGRLERCMSYDQRPCWTLWCNASFFVTVAICTENAEQPLQNFTRHYHWSVAIGPGSNNKGAHWGRLHIKFIPRGTSYEKVGVFVKKCK